jgi:hypothetical protein
MVHQIGTQERTYGVAPSDLTMDWGRVGFDAALGLAIGGLTFGFGALLGAAARTSTNLYRVALPAGGRIISENVRGATHGLIRTGWNRLWYELGATGLLSVLDELVSIIWNGRRDSCCFE